MSDHRIVPPAHDLPEGVTYDVPPAEAAGAFLAKAGISVDLIDDGTTRVILRAPADAFDKVFADGVAYVSPVPIEPTEYHHPTIDRLREENAELRRKLEAAEVFEAMFKGHRDELLQAPTPQTHVPEFGSYGSATAAMDVIDERLRQQRVEGWKLEHDDIHKNGELAGAAACYILHNLNFKIPNIKLGHQAAMLARELWPWDWSWWKPTDQRRDLVKAAALLIAEIERIDRAASATEGLDDD